MNPPPSQERIEARRGFYRPPTSNGLVFACVSLVLVAIAIAGTLFFFSHPDSKHEPVSSASLTSADHPVPSETAPAPLEPTPVPNAVPEREPVKTITTKDLPSVPVARPSSATEFTIKR